MYQQEIQHQCCAGITAADAARWSEDDDHIEEMYRTGQTSIYTGPQPQATPQQEQQAEKGAARQAASLVAAWREQFPQHPALPEIEIAYLARLPERAFHPRQIAVLLPANPRLLGATEAIRDGLLAAYFEREHVTPPAPITS